MSLNFWEIEKLFPKSFSTCEKEFKKILKKTNVNIEIIHRKLIKIQKIFTNIEKKC